MKIATIQQILLVSSAVFHTMGIPLHQTDLENGAILAVRAMQEEEEDTPTGPPTVEPFEEVENDIEDAAEDAGAAVGEAAGQIGETAEDVAGEVGGWVETAIDEVDENAGDENAGEAIDQVGETAGNLADEVEDGVANAIEETDENVNVDVEIGSSASPLFFPASAVVATVFAGGTLAL